jgi:predicted nucleic acid-binding protein
MTFAARTFTTMPADRVAVDANVLVYALYRDAPQHTTSRAFLERAQHGRLTLCFTAGC